MTIVHTTPVLPKFTWEKGSFPYLFFIPGYDDEIFAAVIGGKEKTG